MKTPCHAKQTPLLYAWFAIALVFTISAPIAHAEDAPKPNILFIAIDDLRPELGCYGADYIKSPNIDGLAAQGVLFKRAYCQAPMCAPSRTSLLTGVHTRGAEDRMFNVKKLAPGKPTLPATFRQAGYYTMSNGKIFHQPENDAANSWSEPPFSLINGPKGNNHMTFHNPASAKYVNGRGRGPYFETADVPDNAYIDGQTCEKVINDMRRLAKMDQPFFMACGFVRPHLPFYAPKKYWDLYDHETIALADNRYRPENAPSALTGSGEIRSYSNGGLEYNSDEYHRCGRHGYYACVSYADALVGKLLAELDELGLRKNTIVVVWGDHGWNLGEHSFWGKHNLLHNSTHAPLIISAPGFKKNVSTDGIVELVDIYPTLCELAGLTPPDHLEGESMVPLLRNPEAPGKEAAFTTWSGGLVATTRDFTYTEYNDQPGMLFDRRTDPEENVNVLADPHYAETVGEMQKLLHPTMERESGENVAEAPPAFTSAPGYEGQVPLPTFSEVSYGPHERHVLDFWKAESDKPTPLVLVIHGGGWMGGNKERLSRFADPMALLKAGVSVAAINYRLIPHAKDVEPPVKAPMMDSARALQFLRSKAKEWNIDPTRIGAAGGSAGACTALWLAYHDDLADPDSDDPVARESSRLSCAAVRGPQTSLDPKQMKEWIPNIAYGGHAFGKKNFTQFLADRDEILPWIAEYSPYAQVDAGDPPSCLIYGAAPDVGKVLPNATHSPNFGAMFQKRCQEVGIACHVIYSEDATVRARQPADYLIKVLTAGR